MLFRFSVVFHIKVRKVGQILWLLLEPSAFVLEIPVPFQAVSLSFQNQHLILGRLQKKWVFSFICYAVLRHYTQVSLVIFFTYFLAKTNCRLATKKDRLRETESPFKWFFVVNSKCNALVMALLDDRQEMDSEKLAKIRFLGCFVWFINYGTWIYWFGYDAAKKKIQSKIPRTKFAFRFDSNTLLKGYLDTTWKLNFYTFYRLFSPLCCTCECM